MDPTTEAFAGFGSTIRFEDLPSEVVKCAKIRLIDGLGCAIGGADAPPSRIARALAGRVASDRGARVLGLKARSTPEMAAFANGIMVRYLDFNDSSGSPLGLGHPSDMISAIVAVADAWGSSGRQLIAGIVAAYESCLAMEAPFMKRGWDQGASMALGVTVGAGAILGLGPERIGHAIAIAIAPNVPLRVTRSGSLSMWKAAATAAATRDAVFAIQLAAEGFTGPARVFEGRNGLWEQVTGPFSTELPPQRSYRILDTNIKGYPMAHNMHPVVSTLVDLTSEVPIEEITSIQVRTHKALHFESGSEPEKWDPRTRETADHSLPYVMARALLDRTITPSSFSPAAIADPRNRRIMSMITVAEDPAFTAAREDPNNTDRRSRAGLSELEIRTRSGRAIVGRTDVPRGHSANPMSDAEIEAKFRGMAVPVSTPERVDRVLESLWQIEDANNIGAAVNDWADIVPATS